MKASGGCVQCGRRLGARAEFLFYRPDGSGAYLCGRRACADLYNGTAAAAEPCGCGAHQAVGK